MSLGIAEELMQRDRSETYDVGMETAETKIRTSLSSNPTDSFLWLMIYSVKIARGGFDPKEVAFLEQSYHAGALEGWVSLRRNGLALSIFPLLTVSIQDTVVAEFAAIVDSGFLDEATAILTSVGWEQRDRLLGGLQQVDIGARERLAKRLRRQGFKVGVPGVEMSDRPW
ncbi:hypothetical protein [Bradyrhizobium sp. 30]|uniref:hypothetical protein n=1 Tax=Bradyrhizobium sp. 30 TaxID=2782669 RepID=UPI001FFC2359|nr:hypothetical protein [Bradyrhizobium sp. 30]MCK1294836.1 hypothetical protein [Bradyrhizobium sp. 30]